MPHGQPSPLTRNVKKFSYDLYNYGLKHWARDSYLVWPPVRTQDEMDDVLARLRYYFCNGEGITVPRENRNITPRGKTPAYLGREPIRARFRFPVMQEGARRLRKLALGHKGVLLIRPTARPAWDRMLNHLPNIAPFGREMAGAEASWVMKLFYGPEQRRRAFATWQRFKDWKRALTKKKKVYLLCTGPSLDRFQDFDFSDGHVIGGNTFIHHEEFMRRANPIAVAAVEPNFFFGPSNFAHEYRQALRAAMVNHNFAFFTQEKYHHLLQTYLAEFSHRTFIVPADYVGIVPDLQQEWALPPARNILTALMLPLAFTLADEIEIIGADGRSSDEQSARESNGADSVAQAHPLSYQKSDEALLYSEYCDILEGQIQYIERRGGRVRSLTDSQIPALKKRRKAGE